MPTRLVCALSVLLAGITIFLSACDKDKAEQTHLQIRMTDNPYDASEVNVDIREVRVKFNDEDTEDWVSLNTAEGIYNLLDYQNGIDTLLAEGMVPVGTVKEIRFILGSENSITIDNVSYPLTIPSGSESGLKIKLNRVLNSSDELILIDFDAALSILQTGNGDYKLKPVLKIK